MVMPALRAIEPDDHGADHPHFHDHDDLPRHGGRFDSILDAIGYTPLVEIPRMSPNPTSASSPSWRCSTRPARSRIASRST